LFIIFFFRNKFFILQIPISVMLFVLKCMILYTLVTLIDFYSALVTPVAVISVR